MLPPQCPCCSTDRAICGQILELTLLPPQCPCCSVVSPTPLPCCECGEQCGNQKKNKNSARNGPDAISERKNIKKPRVHAPSTLARPTIEPMQAEGIDTDCGVNLRSWCFATARGGLVCQLPHIPLVSPLSGHFPLIPIIIK